MARLVWLPAGCDALWRHAVAPKDGSVDLWQNCGRSAGQARPGYATSFTTMTSALSRGYQWRGSATSSGGPSGA